MMRALLVEHQATNARTLAAWLRGGNIHAQPTGDADDAIGFLRAYRYDIAIIGGLPAHGNAARLVRQVRLLQIGTPAVIVSPLADRSAKVEAFEAGVDDYLTTPIERDEFLARIRAIIRRANGFAEPVLRAGPIEVELGAREARVHGRTVRLTAMEFSVLELLLLRRGLVLTKEAFLNHLYGGMDEPDAKIIDVFVCKLRRKLAEAGSAAAIETVRGRGYVLREAPSRPAYRESARATP
ncbi:response regulator transcription factor [Elioraea sp.]|uniref:response regulator transcription factor n=1 Tax=Elioraea sp. TaxID=2185103 RepID=UPI003F711AC1